MLLLRRVAPLALLGLAACALEPGELAIEPTFAPLARESAAIPLTLDDLDACSGPIAGQYVVTLAVPESPALAERVGAGERRSLRRVGSAVLHGVSEAQLFDLRADPDVLSVTPDHYACASGKPQQPPAPQTLPAGVDRVGGDETANTGAGVRVCVVDSGVDYNHPDLAPNYVGGQDFINGDSDPMDDNGHGTHVAGTIAAANNSGDVVGVAPGASLLAAKVLNRRGSGSYSAINAGIDYCVAQGAKVINMSLGGSFADPNQEAALQRARDAGVTVVVASGNEDDDLDVTAHYPANYDGLVITVAAAWVEDAERPFGSPIFYPTFSNYGSPVDISAPGVYVVSTKRGGGTTSMSGTSMASPHVAGGAALYLASNPNASPAQVESALEANTEDVNNISRYPDGVVELLNVRGL